MSFVRYYVLEDRHGGRHVTKDKAQAGALTDRGWRLVDVKDYYA